MNNFLGELQSGITVPETLLLPHLFLIAKGLSVEVTTVV